MKDNVSTSHTPCLYYLLTNVKCMHSILHVLRKKEHNSHEKKESEFQLILQFFTVWS